MILCYLQELSAFRSPESIMGAGPSRKPPPSSPRAEVMSSEFRSRSTAKASSRGSTAFKVRGCRLGCTPLLVLALASKSVFAPPPLPTGQQYLRAGCRYHCGPHSHPHRVGYFLRAKCSCSSCRRPRFRTGGGRGREDPRRHRHVAPGGATSSSWNKASSAAGSWQPDVPRAL